MRLFKFCCWHLPIVLLWFSNTLFAQGNPNLKLYLKNGTVEPPANLSGKATTSAFRKNASYGIGKLIVVQFYGIPDEQSVGKLKSAGIELLEYIPDNAYTAVVHSEPDIALLNSVNARAIIELSPEQKIHPVLTGSDLPEHAVKVPGKVDVSISYPRSLALEDVRRDLQKSNFEIISEALSRYQVLEVRLDTGRLMQLAALPWLQYIEPIPMPALPLNDKSTAGTRANMLAAGLPSGVKLSGEGVTIGIGDNGNPTEHGDMSGRIVSHIPIMGDWHGVHVTGTAAGAGIVNEKFKGYAPRALVVKRSNEEIWREASSLFQEFGMVVTSNSYASGSGGSVCPGFGGYTFNSYVLDRQAGELPYLQHVFAAGNSGNAAPCSGFPAGFGNVNGEYASAKNVISAGRTLANEGISTSSSKGPVQDGRIKPDLTAPGSSIYSTMPDDVYEAASGTSMAAPAVAGGAALLYQRYRQLHNQQNPQNALVKALLCNGASDKGLAGPDFSYGFGLMNLFRSVTMLDKGYYRNGTLTHQVTNEFQITIPAGTALVKAMLYWNDIAASPLAGKKTLVNNLDLELSRPDGTIVYPLVPNPATPATRAVAGVDTVNNAEQIVIENPNAGTYTLKVKGAKIPSGSQEYFLVYDVVEKSTTLTYPIGSERFTKGDAIYISWDSYGNPTSTYAVSYSLNNGASWTTINAAVPAGGSQQAWTVPDAFTATAKIRLVQNETGIVKESAPFSIMALPVLTLEAVQCEGYAAVRWTAVTGASDYEVMRLQGDEMKPVGVTTGLQYTFNGLSRDTTYYFSVRPRLSGVPGRRAVAVKRKPDNGTCSGAISDNDVGIDSIISPKGSGRMFTSTGLSATQSITIRIRNFDDQPITRSFEVGYSTGSMGAPVHWETITSGIAALGQLEHTFNKTVDFYAVGDYLVNVFVKLEGDMVQLNNQKAIQLTQLPNPSIALPYMEDFESLPLQTLRTDKIGLVNGPGYDFTSEGKIGRLRTYAESGGAYSGEKALMLDGDNGNYTGYQSSVYGTYNLEGYKARGEEVRLSFRLRQDGGSGAVYIRGKDTDPWILAFFYHQYQYGAVDRGFKLHTIQVSELLKNNSQELSSSFQLKWGQNWGKGFYTIDDVRLYTTRSDVALAELVAPKLSACGYGSQKFSALVKNNGDEDIFNLPLLVTVDGHEAARESIPFVRAGSDTLYSFNAYSNLSVEGEHVVKAIVNYGFDVKPINDFTQIIVTTQPTISTFPYLEDFENGAGGWQPLDSVWQFGRPNSAKVKSAASGDNAWKTNLTGTYSSDSVAYLYSPCLDLNSVASLRLSFSFFIDQAACGDDCEMPVIEYTSGGVWSRLYGIEWGSLQGRSRWRSASVYIPGYSTIRLRIGVKGNSLNPTEGMAIDDIHIYNMSHEINFESSPNPILEADVQGDGWVDFTQFGWLVASIQPNGQELGSISLMTYLKNDEVKDRNGQYYMSRSYKFGMSQPTFPKPVGVRLYFLDADVERLVNAPEKPGVSKPASAYEMTVTKYAGINEDGDLTNNADRVWGYFPKTAVKVVPYWNGYYIEFETTSFSEFWLAKGFLGLGDPMPVTLAAFSARKQLTSSENKPSVVLEWQTTEEKDFSHFEIEVARDRESLLKKMFSKIGEVRGNGDNASPQRYSFTDDFPATTGPNYYRLKMIDTDGSFEYSSIRSVNFDGEPAWKVFPNPVKDKIYVEFAEKAGKSVTFSVSDVGGRVVFTGDAVADGTVQKKEIDLSSGTLTPGIYLLKVVSEDREKVFKIIRK
jgi:hypothetical protein